LFIKYAQQTKVFHFLAKALALTEYSPKYDLFCETNYSNAQNMNN